jgi:hypothetical protein
MLLGPDDLDVELLGLLALAQDGEAHLGPGVAPDQAHRVPQRHVDDVDVLAAVFGHGDDLVLRAQRAVLVGGSAGDDALGHGVAVLLRERDADPLQGEGHADPEVLENAGREVVRVRVQGRGEGVEEGRVDVILRDLEEPAEAPVVAGDQLLLRLLQGSPVAHVVGHLEVHQTPQQVLALGVVLRVAALLGVEDDAGGGVDLVVFLEHVAAHELRRALVTQEQLLLDQRDAPAAAGLHVLEHARQGGPHPCHLRLGQQGAGGVLPEQVVLDDALLDLRGQLVVGDVVAEVHPHELGDGRAAGRRGGGQRRSPEGKKDQREDLAEEEASHGVSSVSPLRIARIGLPQGEN